MRNEREKQEREWVKLLLEPWGRNEEQKRLRDNLREKLKRGNLK